MRRVLLVTHQHATVARVPQFEDLLPESFASCDCGLLLDLVGRCALGSGMVRMESSGPGSPALTATEALAGAPLHRSKRFPMKGRILAGHFPRQTGMPTGWVETQPPAKDPPLGKKEAARLAAATTAGEAPDWGDYLRPPPSPRFTPRLQPKQVLVSWHERGSRCIACKCCF